MSEDALSADEISRLAAGWLEEFGDALYQHAVITVRSPEVAEDLVQETLIAGMRSYGSFQMASSVKTWLFAIMRNKIGDHFRKKKREKSRQHADGDRDSLSFFDNHGQWVEAVGKWPQPGQSLENEELWRVFDQCCEKMADSLSIPFRLREIEQVEFAEICEILHITSTNLSVRLHRARLGLRKCLEENWFLT